MIQALPDAPDGIVSSLDTFAKANFTLGSATLCRNTAPLVPLAYALLQRSIPCCILGRDIASQLCGLIRKARAQTVEELKLKLNATLQRDISRLQDQRKFLAADRVQDQLQALFFFIKDSRDPEHVIQKIEKLFTDSGHPADRITLSTIHKSKGLEYPTVFLLDFHSLLPSRYATQPWQLQQERNLQYVAITRSMDKLFYVKSENPWKD